MTDSTVSMSFQVMGRDHVGKTSLVSRFCENNYTDEYTPTYGLNFDSKEVDIGDKLVKVNLLDVSGKQEFYPMSVSYYKYKKGIILVFDISKRETFDFIKKEVDYIKKEMDDGTELMLVGNKCDLIEQREVTYEEALELGDELNVPYYEVSARSNINVEEIFKELVQLCLNK